MSDIINSKHSADPVFPPFQFGENKDCWMGAGRSDWFLALPVLASIALNVFFLVRVIMILR